MALKNVGIAHEPTILQIERCLRRFSESCRTKRWTILAVKGWPRPTVRYRIQFRRR